MNKKKNMIMGVLLALIAVMGVAYAAFASNLNINGTANINSTWDLRITNIKELSKTSGVTITSAPTYTGTTATFNVDLTSPGDNIEYQVTLENKGTLDALLENITANKTANNSINFEVTGINKGDSLNSNTSKIITIKISYVQTESSGIKEENNLSISMTFVQNLGQEITPATPIVTLPIPSEACFAFSPTTGTITDYYDNEGNNTSNPACPRALEIPSKIGGVSVTIIGPNAFQYNQLTNVVIPNSVTEIKDSAFFINKLTNVVIPNSVIKIANKSFNNNQLPDSQAFIYERNSDGTEDKTTVVSYGGAKRNITIPSGVTTLTSWSFADNNLTSVEIPSSVNSIGNAAFNASNGLPDDQAFIYRRNSDGTEDKTTIVSYGGANKTITIPSGVTTLKSWSFCYDQLTSVVIPNSVTTIDESAFKSNQLTSVVIPNSVTTIGNIAFSDNKLTSVTIKSKNSSSGFLTYGTNIWGWASGYNDSNIVWNG